MIASAGFFSLSTTGSSRLARLDRKSAHRDYFAVQDQQLWTGRMHLGLVADRPTRNSEAAKGLVQIRDPRVAKIAESAPARARNRRKKS